MPTNPELEENAKKARNREIGGIGVGGSFLAIGVVNAALIAGEAARNTVPIGYIAFDMGALTVGIVCTAMGISWGREADVIDAELLRRQTTPDNNQNQAA